ncbi:hypothetical protein ACFLZP_04775 [Patescibacteria group bacterium]
MAKKIYQKPKSIFVYILILFFISRLILTLAGLLSRQSFKILYEQYYDWHYSSVQALDLWGVWDSGWYLDIAQEGYSVKLQSNLPKRVTPGQANYAFFPLYPLVIRLLSRLTGSYFFSGVILSNLFFLISAFFYYQLVLLDADPKTARRSLRYLFLYPLCFILSGVFTESLFLMLLVICFYLARKKKWFFVGIIGFLLSLTRSIGVFVCLPLFYEYFSQRKFKLKLLDLKAFSFFLFPLGLGSFYFFIFRLTGDVFAHLKLEQKYWQVIRANPLKTLLFGLVGGQTYHFFTLFTLACLGFLIVYRQKIRLSYFFLALVLFALPLSIGKVGLMSILRYSVVIFPLPLLLGKLTSNRFFDLVISVALVGFQVYFMMLWSIGFLII